MFHWGNIGGDIQTGCETNFGIFCHTVCTDPTDTTRRWYRLEKMKKNVRPSASSDTPISYTYMYAYIYCRHIYTDMCMNGGIKYMSARFAQNSFVLVRASTFLRTKRSRLSKVCFGIFDSKACRVYATRIRFKSRQKCSFICTQPNNNAECLSALSLFSFRTNQIMALNKIKIFSYFR